MPLAARTGAVLAIAIGASGLACEGPPRVSDDASVDVMLACLDDCAPYRCDAGRGECLRGCAVDEPCADGFACVDRACVGTECTVETAPSVCGAYACVNGVCARDCAIAPCAAAFYCRGDLGTCVPRCTQPGEPSCGGFRCDVEVGECESYCLDGELACAAGFACDAGGQCQPDLTAPSCAAGCAPYACVTALDRCATHCADSADCIAPATCVGGACVP